MHGPGTVRAGKWKFYPWKEKKGNARDPLIGREPSDQPVQLYDIVSDIGETKNLAQQHPEVVSRLQKLYDQHVAEITANKRPTAELARSETAPTPNRPGKNK